MCCKDQKTCAAAFQRMVMTTHREAVQEAIQQQPHKTVLATERSVESAYNVFTNVLHDAKALNDAEFDEIATECKHMVENEPELKGLIHAMTPPGECMSRIAKRKRQGEADIAEDCLQALHEHHEKWIGQLTVPILQITGEDPDKDITQIENFIEKHSRID